MAIQSHGMHWKYPTILGDRNMVLLLDGRRVPQIFLTPLIQVSTQVVDPQEIVGSQTLAGRAKPYPKPYY